MVKLLPFVGLLLLIHSGTLVVQPGPVEREFTAEILFDIASEGEQYLLGYPEDVAVDREGRIYVADRRASDIKMFDAGGNYIKAFGRSGKGPGEFLRINSVHVDENGRLVVADQFNFRISLFNAQQEPLTSSLLPMKNIGWPIARIIDFNDQYLLLYYKPYPFDQHVQPGPVNMFHLADRNLDAIQTHFGSYDSLDYGETNLNFHIGDVQQYDNGSVVFVPVIYDGQLYQFGMDGEVNRHTGYFPPSDEFEMLEPEDRHTPVLERVKSLGLMALETGEFVHFTIRQRESQKKFYVEFFDKDLNLKSYGDLDGLGHMEDTDEFDNFFPIRFKAYSNGRFYMKYWREDMDAMTVRVFRIKELQ